MANKYREVGRVYKRENDDNSAFGIVVFIIIGVCIFGAIMG